MIIATVIGKLEPKCSVRGFEEIRWIRTQADGRILVAADPLGAEAGQLVLLAQGSAAGHYRMDYCCDTLVVAVLDDQAKNG